MTEAYSPRDIIQQLDVDEIDQAIDDLRNELAALQQLRKVAAAKSGKASKGGRGNGQPAKSKMADRLDHAHQVLSEFGSMTYRKLAERVGYDTTKAFWILKGCEKDSRFLVDGETVSLAK